MSNDFKHAIANPESDIGFAITSYGGPHIVMLGCSFHGVSVDIHLSPEGAEKLAASLLVTADEARRLDRRVENIKQSKGSA